MTRFLMTLAGLVTLCLLAACSAPQPKYSAAEMAKPVQGPYRDGGAPSITLVTVISNNTGSGGHTALVINADQRVIFDPAGSFYHPQIRREGDVLIGINDAFLDAYYRMHARPAYYVRVQTVPVSAASAQKALELAFARGRVGKANCARVTSEILKQLPEFRDLKVTWFPNSLAAEFEAKTGVKGRAFYEDFTPAGGDPAKRAQWLPYAGA